MAAKAGFCFGVKRALDMAERTAESSQAVSLGPLIHNQQVVKRLSERGIRVVNDLSEVTSDQALIIRSHGVGPSVYEGTENKGIRVVDATCPFVQKAQRLAAESAQLGRQVIVMGDKLHPEVQGILGWAGEQAIPIQTVEEAKKLPFYPHLAVLAQTTQLAENFMRIVEELKLHTGDITVHNTICNATAERQKVARELAETVDVMVVVGGRNSANTRKLASICAERSKTYLIETVLELETIWFSGAESAGLTAGASTPDWIIEEVYKKMSDMNENENQNENEMNMASWLEGLQKIHLGARVSGTVVKITREEIFVDIGWKCEGVIPLNEFSIQQTSLEDHVSIGDTVSAVVIRVENEEGYTVLSKRKADEEGAHERLEKVAESKEEIQAKVVEVVKGGLVVDVGLRGFVPASQIQLSYVEDLNQFLGQTLRLRLIEFDASKRKVVLSQKIILEEEKAIKRDQLLETLKEGDLVSGIVRRMADFGVFVDIGGMDGLLHISDISYSRIKHPSDVLSIGDEVEVQVLRLDHQTGKLALGLKQLKESPWVQAGVNYPLGSIIQGKVARITPFGAFVALGEGVDGLVHISQLSEQRVNKVEDVLKVGDMVTAKVIQCNPEEKRISLSIREAIADSSRANDTQALAGQAEIQPVTIGDAVGKIRSENQKK